MPDLRLFAVTDAGAVALPVPPGATALRDLFADLDLGVYTAFRTFGHREFLHLDRHLARLRDSAARSGIDGGIDEARLRRALDAVCTAYPGDEMRVRIDLLAGTAGDAGARELIALSPFSPPDPRLARDGVSVRTTQEIARDDPLAKTADFVERRAALEARLGDAHEYLMIDGDGVVLEGLRSNFYGVRGGSLVTVGDSALRGVTRGIVLDLAQAAAVAVDLGGVRVGELAVLDEAALSASSQGLVPVVRIDDRPVGGGAPGPVVTRLVADYDAYVRANVVAAV